ncbi:hypothetical protein BDV93DRAFT_290131 [Ceratobasidium sp. AG-I]|nr:hypothetical protein BDV93DRAFT_290131 [Ceratobasidium sp. AG-I]
MRCRVKITFRTPGRKLLWAGRGFVHDGSRLLCTSGIGPSNAARDSCHHGLIFKRSYSQKKNSDASNANDEVPKQSESAPISASDSKVSRRSPRSTRPPSPTKIDRPRIPPVNLLPRTASLVKVVPDYYSLPINLSLPPLISPSNKSPTRIPTTFPRPPYLSPKYAHLLPLNTDDPYLLTRCVEMFGLPGPTRWIRYYSMVLSKATIQERVNDFLGKLPWRHQGTTALKEAAWAEHLIAMQNPTLKGEAEEYDLSGGGEINAPSWPSAYASVSPPTPAPGPSLSWSSSGERDIPEPRSRPPSSYIRDDEPSFGRQDFPRPRRIARLFPTDKSLVLVFASPTARRAIMTAYSYWLRRELREAYDLQVEVPDKAKNVLPPVEKSDFGELGIGKMDAEAIQWAEEAGWSPAVRLRHFNGGRARKDDVWHTKRS